MKLKRELEEKAVSALNLAKISGKVKGGLNEAKRALENNRLKLLFVASDIQEKEKKGFDIPHKENFSFAEVRVLLAQFENYLKKKKKIKQIDIRKEIGILKIRANDLKVPVFEISTRKKIGKAVGIQAGISCAAILNPGRAKDIFRDIEAENKKDIPSK